MMTTGHSQLTTGGYNYQDYVPTERITCPICEVNCTSLENLNRHLDIQHNEEENKSALLSWLRNAQKKVTTSLVNSGGSGGKPTLGGSTKWTEQSLMNISFQNLSLSTNNNPAYFVSDTIQQQQQQGEFVIREHWQRETGNDPCNLCLKIVGKQGAGKQHCRQCGKLFCDAHTQYEIKLNRQAQHDVENGIWSKVCGPCYQSRRGYMEKEGATRSKTEVFLKARIKTIDRVYLESNRLEKRLEKLAKIHQSADGGGIVMANNGNGNGGGGGGGGILSPSSASLLSLDRSDSTSSRDSLGSMLSPKSSFVSNSNSILSMKLKYRDGEQSVTKWQDDRSVKTCPYCENSFTLINRKHHCRLCGKVVCGNARCSKMIPLFIDMSSDTFGDEPVGDTRACRDCQRSVFRRKLKNEEASKPLPIIQLYNQLSITRKNIERQLPKFHETILMLEKENVKAHTHESFIKAAKIRKSLLDNFTLYDTLAKSIKTLPIRSPCMKRLQSNICNAANIYLQQNMLPLQMLPRILKSSDTSSNNKKKATTSNNNNNSTAEELQEQLRLYLEQSNLVEGFIKDANHDRKYDDVKTLKISLDELHAEINRIRDLLEQ